MRWGAWRLGAASFAVAASLAAAPALAASVDECVDANTQAQVLRRGEKLAASRQKLQVCIDRSCPEVVRADCAQRLDDLNGAQPTIVFDVKDGAGADVVAVRVKVDGQPVAEKLDGSAIPVDPGERTFTFEAAGQPPVTRVLVIKEGEKQRRERIVVGPQVPPKAQDEGAGKSARTRQVVGIAAGSVGLVGIAVGSALGVLAMNRWNRAKSECSVTSCTDHAGAVSDHDATVALGNGSTASFVVGGALLVTGVVLFITGRRDARVVVGWDPGPVRAPGRASLGMLSAKGSF